VLQRLVGAPLRAHVDGRELVVVPDVAVHHLPWGRILGAGQPTSVAPSAALWHRAASRDQACEGHVAIVAGPGLAGAEAEARRIAELHPGATVLAGPAATVEAVGAALDGARIAHLAAHGTFRRDNPLFSAIELTDGPAVVHDLERISRPPAVIVLASCNSALGQLQPTNDLVGLATALLSGGTRVALAAVVPLPDIEVVDIMVRLHARLAAGDRPAAALAHAAASEERSERLRFLADAALVCYGAG
jgi:CHAT domain-containing protein